MGCASSKPSKNKKDSSSKSSKLNKKSKSNDVVVSKSGEASLSNNNINHKKDSIENNEDSPIIHLDKNLIDQIKKNEVQVIEYIVKIVHRDLNNELTKHSTGKKVGNTSPDFASTALAAKNQQENDDLIIDVSSKAINTIVNNEIPNTTLTYKSLNLALRSWPFICKNQGNKTRICDITTETIKQCLHAIDTEIKDNSNFDLVSYLAQNLSLTPPTTPETQKECSQEEIWNRDAILLNRTKANQIARLLFLSNKARPVIHTSNRIKDAYFVNRELPDKTQITITDREIDEILNNSTYKNNPHITPISPRKSESSDMAQKIEISLANTIVQTNDNITTMVLEDRKVEYNILNTTPERAVGGDLDSTCVTVEDLTWANLSDPSDFEKVNVKDLTKDNVEEEKVPESTVEVENTVVGEQSADTYVVDPSFSAPVPEISDYLSTVINEINNNLQENLTYTSEDTEKIFEEPSTSTVTPPSTPNAVEFNGLIDLVEEIVQSSDKTFEEEPQKVEETIEEKVLNGESENDEAVNNESQISKDEGNMDPVLKQELLDDRFYNNDTFKNGPPVNGNDAENKAATKIQSTFKGEEVRKEDENVLNVTSPVTEVLTGIKPVESEREVHELEKKIEDNHSNGTSSITQVITDISTEEHNQKVESKVNNILNVTEVIAEVLTDIEQEEPAQEVESKGDNILNVTEVLTDISTDIKQEETSSVTQVITDISKDIKQEYQEVTQENDLINDQESDLKKRLERLSSGIFNEAMENAATKIQCTYRGFKTRKSLKSDPPSFRKKVEAEMKNNGEIEKSEKTEDGISIENENSTEIITESEPVTEDMIVEQILEVLETKTELPEKLPKKSGSKKRRNRKKSPKQDENVIITKEIENNGHKNSSESSQNSELVLNNNSDYEMIAATKIQSTFRGFKTRKDLAKQTKE